MDFGLHDSAAPLIRTAALAVLAYASLVVLLRATGKRTLSKMNAFDFVVTVALGSTLATTILSKEVSLSEGVLALALLVGLQFAITWSSVRVGWIRAVVTGEPALLLHRGTVLPEALRSARVTETEIRAAVRSAGIASVADVEAVVLETDGSFSVVRREPATTASSLRDVVDEGGDRSATAADRHTRS
jgi:uncharacterized membrane protein YcaP (DUF421 family)